MARGLHAGLSPFSSTLLALMGGACIGIFSAFLQRKGYLSDLLSGILLLFMLHSLNLSILGQPSISLYECDTPLNKLSSYLPHETPPLVCLLLIILPVTIAFIMLLHSPIGLRLRAFGANKALLNKIGYKAEGYRLLSLMTSSVLAALSGLMTASLQGYVDVTMGMGLALTAIAAVMIGETLHSSSTRRGVGFTIMGTGLYFLCLNLGLRLGLNPLHLKLILGIILALLLSRFRILAFH